MGEQVTEAPPGQPPVFERGVVKISDERPSWKTWAVEVPEPGPIRGGHVMGPYRSMINAVSHNLFGDRMDNQRARIHELVAVLDSACGLDDGQHETLDQMRPYYAGHLLTGQMLLSEYLRGGGSIKDLAFNLQILSSHEEFRDHPEWRFEAVQQMGSSPVSKLLKVTMQDILLATERREPQQVTWSVCSAIAQIGRGSWSGSVETVNLVVACLLPPGEGW